MCPDRRGGRYCDRDDWYVRNGARIEGLRMMAKARHAWSWWRCAACLPMRQRRENRSSCPGQTARCGNVAGSTNEILAAFEALNRLRRVVVAVEHGRHAHGAVRSRTRPSLPIVTGARVDSPSLRNLAYERFVECLSGSSAPPTVLQWSGTVPWASRELKQIQPRWSTRRSPTDGCRGNLHDGARVARAKALKAWSTQAGHLVDIDRS